MALNIEVNVEKAQKDVERLGASIEGLAQNAENAHKQVGQKLDFASTAKKEFSALRKEFKAMADAMRPFTEQLKSAGVLTSKQQTASSGMAAVAREVSQAIVEQTKAMRDQTAAIQNTIKETTRLKREKKDAAQEAVKAANSEAEAIQKSALTARQAGASFKMLMRQRQADLKAYLKAEFDGSVMNIKIQRQKEEAARKASEESVRQAGRTFQKLMDFNAKQTAAEKRAGEERLKNAGAVFKKIQQQIKAAEAEIQKLDRAMDSFAAKGMTAQDKYNRGLANLRRLAEVRPMEWGDGTEKNRQALLGLEKALERATVAEAKRNAVKQKVIPTEDAATSAIRRNILALEQSIAAQNAGLLKLSKNYGIATQGAAAFRAGLMGANLGFGIFTSSTILAATAVYSLSKAMAYSVQVGGSFENTFKRVEVLLGGFGGKSVEGIEVLRKQILDLAESTQFTANEVAEAAQVLAQAGLNTLQIYNSLPGVLNLAAIGMISIAEAADIAVTVMYSFQRGSEELDHIVDILAATTVASNLTIQNLGKTMQYVSGTANMAGVSLEQTAAAIGTLANAGIKGSMAGTVLRRIIVELSTQGKAVKESFKELGIDASKVFKNFNDGKGEVLDLVGFFQVLQKELQGLSRQEAIDKVKTMFKQWAVTGSLSLALLAERMADLQVRLGAVAGTAEQMRRELQSTFVGAVENLQSVIENIGVDAFSIVAERAQSEVRQFSEYLKANSAEIAGAVANALELIMKIIRLTLEWADAGATLIAGYTAYRIVTASLGSIASASLTAAKSAEQYALKRLKAAEADRVAKLQTDSLTGSYTRLAAAQWTAMAKANAGAASSAAGMTRIASAAGAAAGMIGRVASGLLGLVSWVGVGVLVGTLIYEIADNLGWLGDEAEISAKNLAELTVLPSESMKEYIGLLELAEDGVLKLNTLSLTNVEKLHGGMAQDLDRDLEALGNYQVKLLETTRQLEEFNKARAGFSGGETWRNASSSAAGGFIRSGLEAIGVLEAEEELLKTKAKLQENAAKKAQLVTEQLAAQHDLEVLMTAKQAERDSNYISIAASISNAKEKMEALKAAAEAPLKDESILSYMLRLAETAKSIGILKEAIDLLEGEKRKKDAQERIAAGEAAEKEAINRMVNNLKNYISEWEKATASISVFRREQKELNEVTNALTSGTAEAAKVLREMGLSTEEARKALDFRQETIVLEYLSAVLGQVDERFKTLPETARQVTQAKLTETEALNKAKEALIASGNATPAVIAAFEKFEGTIRGVANGTAEFDKKWADFNRTFNEDFARAISGESVEQIANLLGRPFEDLSDHQKEVVEMRRILKLYGTELFETSDASQQLAEDQDAIFKLMDKGRFSVKQMEEAWRRLWEATPEGKLEKQNAHLKNQIALTMQGAEALELYNMAYQEFDGQLDKITPRWLAAAQANIKYREELQQTQAVQQTFNSFMEGVGDLFADTFTGGIDSFKDFASQLKNLFKKLLLDLIAMAVKNSIMKALFNQGQGNTEGFWSSIVQGFSSMFGGQSNNANTGSWLSTAARLYGAATSGNTSGSYGVLQSDVLNTAANTALQFFGGGNAATSYAGAGASTGNFWGDLATSVLSSGNGAQGSGSAGNLLSLLTGNPANTGGTSTTLLSSIGRLFGGTGQGTSITTALGNWWSGNSTLGSAVGSVFGLGAGTAVNSVGPLATGYAYGAAAASSLAAGAAGVGGVAASGAMFQGLGTAGYTGLASSSALYGSGQGMMAASGAASGGAAASSMAIPIIGWIIAGMLANDGAYKAGFRANSDLYDSGLPDIDRWVASPAVADKILQKLGMGEYLASMISGSSLHTMLWGLGAPQVKNSNSNFVFGEGGAGGFVDLGVKRKGGWFRSDKHYTERQDLAEEGLETAEEMQESLSHLLQTAAKGIGKIVNNAFTGSLSVFQEYDKKGKPKGDPKFTTNVAGFSKEFDNEEDAYRMLQAEALIQAVDAAMGFTVGAANAVGGGIGRGGSLGRDGRFGRFGEIDSEEFEGRLGTRSPATRGEASVIAQRWRDDLEMMEQGAELLLVISSHLNDGLGLFREAEAGVMTSTVNLVEQYTASGETLVETYQRLVASITLVEDTLGSFNIETGKTREEFLKFGFDLVDALGGLDEASEKLSAFAQAFGEINNNPVVAQRARDRRATLMEDIGLDPDTSAREFKQAFSAIVSTLSSDELAQWIEAGHAIAVVSNALAELRDGARQAEQSLAEQLVSRIAAIRDMGASEAELEEARMYALTTLRNALGGFIDQINSDIANLEGDTYSYAIGQIYAEMAEATTQAYALGAGEEELSVIRRRAELQIAEIAKQLEEFMFGVEGQIAEFEGRTYVHKLREIHRQMDANLRQARALGASEAQLARIRQLATYQASQLISELRSSLNGLLQQFNGQPAEQLSTTVTDNFNGQIEASNALYEAEMQRYEAAQDAIKRIGEFLDSLSISDLAPGDWSDRLGDARRIFMETLSKARAGDPDALNNITGAAKDYLDLASQFFGSTTQYGDIYQFVTEALKGLQGTLEQVQPPSGSPSGGTEGGGNFGGGSTVTQPDTATRAAERYDLALQIAQQIGQLSIMLSTEDNLISVWTLLDEMNVEITELASSLGINLNEINDTTFTGLNILASALGVTTVELVTALEGNISALAAHFDTSADKIIAGNLQGLSEFASAMSISTFEAITLLGVSLTDLASTFGINTAALTGETVAQLQAMATGLNVRIVDLIDELGIQMADLAVAFGVDLNAQTRENFDALVAFASSLDVSLLDMAETLDVSFGWVGRYLAQNFNEHLQTLPGLPSDIAIGLAPYLNAIEGAVDQEALDSALRGLNQYLGTLPSDIGTGLQTFLTSMTGVLRPPEAVSLETAQAQAIANIDTNIASALTELGAISLGISGLNTLIFNLSAAISGSEIVMGPLPPEGYLPPDPPGGVDIPIMGPFPPTGTNPNPNPINPPVGPVPPGRMPPGNIDGPISPIGGLDIKSLGVYSQLTPAANDDSEEAERNLEKLVNAAAANSENTKQLVKKLEDLEERVGELTETVDSKLSNIGESGERSAQYLSKLSKKTDSVSPTKSKRP